MRVRAAHFKGEGASQLGERLMRHRHRRLLRGRRRRAGRSRGGVAHSDAPRVGDSRRLTVLIRRVIIEVGRHMKHEAEGLL